MAEIKGGKIFLAKMRELAEKINQPKTLRVGFLEGASYPDGTPVAMVAAIQNYGAPAAGIPPRPFFSNTVADKSPQWPAGIATLLKNNGCDVDKTLQQTGEVIKGQIQDAINNGSYAPLKPSTVARKGFDKPLIDTAHMLNSVSYDIKTT